MSWHSRPEKGKVGRKPGKGKGKGVTIRDPAIAGKNSKQKKKRNGASRERKKENNKRKRSTEAEVEQRKRGGPISLGVQLDWGVVALGGNAGVEKKEIREGEGGTRLGGNAGFGTTRDVAR